MLEWENGTNRFGRICACFLQLRAGDTVTAVGGLSQDPYADDPGIGRAVGAGYAL